MVSAQSVAPYNGFVLCSSCGATGHFESRCFGVLFFSLKTHGPHPFIGPPPPPQLPNMIYLASVDPGLLPVCLLTRPNPVSILLLTIFNKLLVSPIHPQIPDRNVKMYHKRPTLCEICKSLPRAFIPNDNILVPLQMAVFMSLVQTLTIISHSRSR